MAKISLDQDKVKSFFALHVEKIILGIVVLLLFVFVYTGYSLEGIEQTPDQLSDLATSAVSQMEENTWPVVATEYAPRLGHGERAKESQIPTQDQFYMPDKPYMPAASQQGEKRVDPALFPPTRLEVAQVSGPIAFRMKRGEADPMAELENSELKKEEPKKKKKKKKRRNTGYGGSSSGYSSMGEEDYMSDESGYSDMGMSGYPGEEGEDSYGYGMPGATAGTTAAGKNFPGFRAGMGAIAKPATIVAVKALVEVQRQFDEYERVFSTAMGYNPGRDAPKYLLFTAQRADVTSKPDEEPDETDWKPISNTNSVRLQMQRNPWAGFPKEIVDVRYVSPGLTMPIPPVMMRDLDPLALHSETPRQQAAMRMAARPGEEEETEEEATDPSEVSDLPGAMPGRMPGGMGGGMSGYPGMMSGPGMSGMSMSSGYPESGMSGYPGSGMSGYGESEYDDYGESSYDEEGYSDMSGMSGYGDAGMSGMSGYGYGGMGPMVARGPKSEFLLVRFHDFSAKPGRKYRYRVQLLVEDPNHPQNPMAEPSDRALDDEVKTRLNEVTTKEKADNRRVYYLRTDWSDPSDVIAIAADATTLAGAVEIGRTADVPIIGDTFELSEPKGKVMSVVWDPAYAVDVPGLKEVKRGTVLNFKETADVVHPVNRVYKKMPDFEFHTDRFVVDMRGGESLPGSDTENPLNALGEMAFFDAKGNIFVRNEFDDHEDFELHTIPVIKAPETPYGGDYGSEMDEYGSGGYGDEGY